MSSKKYLAALHQSIVGEALSEKELEECLIAVTPNEDEKRVVENETKLVHKLKMHLIHQEKHHEAKTFIECHQKFKNSNLPKNRDFIIQFMYSLFDKEATLAAIAAKKAAKYSGSVPSSASSRGFPSHYESTPKAFESRQVSDLESEMQANILSHKYGNMTKNYNVTRGKYVPFSKSNDHNAALDRNHSPSQETGYSSLTRSPRTADIENENLSASESRNRTSKLKAYPLEFDATPMPKLLYSQDAKLRDDINMKNVKIPSLHKSVAVTAGSMTSDNYSDVDVAPYWGNSRKDTSFSQSHKNEPSRAIGFPKDYRSLIGPNSGFSRDIPLTTSDITHSRPATSPQQHQISSSGGIKPQGFSSVDLFQNASFNSQNGRPTCASQFLPNTKDIERNLIKDLVFVMQGIDAKYLKCDSKGNYQISAPHPIHPSLIIHTKRIAEIGILYKKIRDYCQKPRTGLMAQGLKHSFEEELQEFYRLIAIIGEEVQNNSRSVDTPMSEEKQLNPGEEMTLLKLSVWVFDCFPRLEVLNSMIDACEGKKGGEMCSTLYQYAQHGDPMVAKLSTAILTLVAKPLYLMLCQWILYGELLDAYNEFFIASDVNCKIEQLWHTKYHIRRRMLPSFITMKSAERILATGKNINFLKEICHNSKGYECRGQIKNLLEKSPVECLFLEEDRLLNTAIEKAYKTTSEMVLHVLIEDSKLLDHLTAIKHYLLLGQGDFIQHLLELIQDELSKPANKLFNHKLAAIVDSAIRATNAQFESEDIQNRLDTRILPASDKDLGWDVFCLDYKVQGPIGTVLTDDVMIRYNQLFNTLWRTKRIETILSTLWKNQTTLFKYQRTIPELGPVLHRSQLLISEMIHFVHQTQYYIMFEATECAWDRLMEDVSKSSDLDQIIASHNKFLDTITSRSLLDKQSRELLNQLRGIFDSVHELKKFLTEFNERVSVEMQYRKNIEPNSSEEREAQREFFANYIMQAKGKIETLYTTTQDLVRSFLLVLNRQADLTLQCLSFRLDFNEYYHLKDSRLSQPLTFQHRRLSNNTTFAPQMMSTSVNATGLNSSFFASMSLHEDSNEF